MKKIPNNRNFGTGGGGNGKGKTVVQKADLTPVNKKIDEIDEKQNKAIENLHKIIAQLQSTIDKQMKFLGTKIDKIEEPYKNRIEVLEKKYNIVTDRNKMIKTANDNLNNEIKKLESRLNNQSAEMLKLKGKIAGTTDLNKETNKMIDEF